MDFEKEYKSLVGRITKAHLYAQTDSTRAVLEDIYPSLSESEDERIRKELKEAFEAYDIESKWNGIPIRSIFAWLEKQKEQKKKNVLIWGEPQVTITVQKQEWSEEDEEMLEYVIGDLNDAKQLFHAKDAIDLCDKEIAWLKSLRPQPKRDCKDCAMFLNGECTKPHWKPSEEQMVALEAATVRYQSTGLESLYEDLKKL